MDLRFGPDRVAAYFNTYNAGDEAAHMALFHPEVTFFGSGTGASSGLVAIRGVYQAARGPLGYLEFTPLEVFGLYPELAVRVEVRRQRTSFKGIWVFRLDESGAIRHLSVIYNLREAMA